MSIIVLSDFKGTFVSSRMVHSKTNYSIQEIDKTLYDLDENKFIEFKNVDNKLVFDIKLLLEKIKNCSNKITTNNNLIELIKSKINCNLDTENEEKIIFLLKNLNNTKPLQEIFNNINYKISISECVRILEQNKSKKVNLTRFNWLK